MKLFLAWFQLLFCLAALADGPRKVAVIVYLPSDGLTKKSAETAIERLKAKECGYEVIDIKLDSNEKVAEKVAERLKGEKIPPTAPVFLHGHGMLDSDKEHAFIARKPKLDNATKSLLPRQLVKGTDLVKAVRANLKYNPVWVSSCQSGGICFEKDVCIGASCKKLEDSYGGEDKIENTLAEMVALLCDPKKFKAAAGDDEGFLTPEKIRAHLCKTLGEKDGKPCYKTDSEKTQMPQVNSFRLYQHTYVPKAGELEGKPRGKTVNPEHE